MTQEQTAKLPPPPEKPDPSECCGSGCIPCILEVYEDEVERWREEVAAIRANAEPDGR